MQEEETTRRKVSSIESKLDALCDQLTLATKEITEEVAGATMDIKTYQRNLAMVLQDDMKKIVGNLQQLQRTGPIEPGMLTAVWQLVQQTVQVLV